MSFSTALSGMKAAGDQLRVTSNNVANAPTNGFKRSLLDLASVNSSNVAGASAGTIGSGVSVAAVKQNFAQGILEATDQPLDFAVNGTGFFVLKDSVGMQTYTRAGSFQVDKEGVIGNSSGSSLVGYVANDHGEITGAQGVLAITKPILAPVATTTVTAGLNFDPSVLPPVQKFVASFTPNNLPDTSTYNSRSQVTVYDTLGIAHEVTSYFVKAPILNTWQVYIGVDGVDVTPTVVTPPAGGTPSVPVAYAAGVEPQPFTLVFDTKGNFIENNTSLLPLSYGTTPPRSVATIYTTKGSMATLQAQDLTINGVQIELAASVDNYSYSDIAGSAINLANSINTSKTKHKTVATPDQTVYNLGLPTNPGPGFTLAAGDLVVNGVNVTGVYANVAALVTYINTAPIPIANINAQVNAAGGFELFNIAGVANGMNITVETDGIVAGGALTFANFSLAGGPLSKVERGTVTLTPNTAITLNTVDLGTVTANGAGAMAAGDLVINGVDISAGTPFASAAALVTYINTGVVSNVSAAIVAGSLVLTDSLGDNISITTAGRVTAANYITFSNLPLVQAATAAPLNKTFLGSPLDKLQPIVIGGNNPANVGFTSGPKYGTVQTNSDPMSVSFTPNSGAVTPQAIKINYTTSTQYQAQYAQLSLAQDGYATGKLLGVSTDDLGIITANYDNNGKLVVGQVALARFANINGLTDSGNTSFMQSSTSGLALIGKPGSSSLGKIQASNLEASNVDLTAELVALIEAQRDFGANAQTLRTADAMTQTMINLR
jgi:flagellar hook protein FlgE